MLKDEDILNFEIKYISMLKGDNLSLERRVSFSFIQGVIKDYDTVFL